MAAKEKNGGDNMGQVGVSTPIKQDNKTTVADTPDTVSIEIELVYDEKLKQHVFKTSDGRYFNTLLKAERHKEKFKVQSSKFKVQKIKK
jgi:hypothetical protein